MINEIKIPTQMPFQALDGGPAKDDPKKMMAAAKKFEGFFMGYIFDQIQQNIPKEGLFGDSQAEGVFQSMFIQQISDQAGKGNRGLGLAEAMVRQMKHPVAESNNAVKTDTYV